MRDALVFYLKVLEGKDVNKGKNKTTGERTIKNQKIFDEEVAEWNGFYLRYDKLIEEKIDPLEKEIKIKKDAGKKSLKILFLYLN
jgi:hypothetical protein